MNPSSKFPNTNFLFSKANVKLLALLVLLVSTFQTSLQAQPTNRNARPVVNNNKVTKILKSTTAPNLTDDVELFKPNISQRPTKEVNVLLPFHTKAMKLKVEEVDGMAIVEGDIVLGPIGLFDGTIQKAVGIEGAEYRWPNGKIPYTIESGHPKARQIQSAIDHINENTNLCVVKRSNESDYVKFVSGSGCWSYVGKQGGMQKINIGSCSFGSIVHEICHAAGLWHEQGRSDRDNYVTINWNNIKEDKKHNFNKHVSDGIDIGSYDCGSIMHYGKTAFSKNGQPTISPKSAACNNIGQRTGLSPKDIAGIKALYPRAKGCGCSAAWVARHGMSSATYQSEFNKYVGECGLKLVHVDAAKSGSSAKYAAIWKKQSGAFVARHGMTSAKYQQEFNEWTGKGYRLTKVSGYSVGSSARYAAIWEKNGKKTPWVARHGMTAAKYQTEFNTWTGKGYRLIHVNGYNVNGKDYYAAIWEKTSGPAYYAYHGLSSSAYQTKFNEMTKKGYRLALIDGYSKGTSARYACIFVKQSGSAWVARHGMTSASYQQEFNKYVGQGYKLSLVSCYNVGGTVFYAALWEK